MGRAPLHHEDFPPSGTSSVASALGWLHDGLDAEGRDLTRSSGHVGDNPTLDSGTQPEHPPLSGVHEPYTASVISLSLALFARSAQRSAISVVTRPTLGFTSEESSINVRLNPFHKSDSAPVQDLPAQNQAAQMSSAEYP